MGDNLAPVIPIDGDGEVAFEIDERKCRHAARGFRVCVDSRTVRCKECEAEVDPFDAVLSYADHWDRWRLNRDMLLRERTRLRAEVDRLKQQRQRLRREVEKAQTGAYRG